MRNKLLFTMTLLAVVISPAVTIAEPGIQAKKTAPDEQIVESIRATMESKVGETKDEIAAKKIEENLKRIEEQRKAEEATRAAEAARVAAQRAVIRVDSRTNFSDLYRAAGARFGVDPAILAAVHMVETGGRGSTSITSYAGAQGPMQFMPATFRAYGVDGNGDGIIDINNVDDAVYSAARYLAANGAASGRIVNALFRYNHSYAYVNKVLAIARGYGYIG